MNYRQGSKKIARTREGGGASANLQFFEAEAVPGTIRAMVQDGLRTALQPLPPEQCHTLVRCVLTAAGVEERQLGTAVLKVPGPPPAEPSAACFAPLTAMALQSGNAIFEGHHRAREAMLAHVRALPELEREHAAGAQAAAPAEERRPLLDERLPPTLMGGCAFHPCLRLQSQGDGFHVTSRLGAVEVSARSLVRSGGSPELDWGKQAEAVQAAGGTLQRMGLGMSRHSVTARRGAQAYTLDVLFVPLPPASSRAIVASAVRMVGSDADGHWLRALNSMEDRFVDRDHGTNRYDLVCGQAMDLHRHARAISARHLENQVKREVLRMRTELHPGEPLSDEARRLTAPHKGRYIRSEALVEQLGRELDAELRPEEMEEARAFLARALARKAPSVQCTRGQVVKSYDRSGVEVATVAGDFEMAFAMKLEGATEPYRGRTVAVELGNLWRLESHCLTLAPRV